MDHYFDHHNDPIGQRITVGLCKLGTALRQRSWKEASAVGLTPTQGQVLAYLRLRPGSILSEVASALAVSRATASDAVSTLARKGLVKKSRHRTNARMTCLELTREGVEAAASAARWPDFLAEAVDHLGEEERRVLLRALLRIIRSLQQRGEIPVSSMCVSCRFFRPYAHQDSARPHHCQFVDAPFGDQDLRLECPDHEPAEEEQAQEAWQVFAAGL